MIVCEYCNSNQKNKYNLKLHQECAKYCLDIQKEKGITKNIKTYECEYCDKIFTRNYSLLSHKKSCKILENNIKKNDENLLENKISELTNKISELSNKNLELKNENLELKKDNQNLLSKIEEYKDTINEFKQQFKDQFKLIENLSNKSTTTNNIVNNRNNNIEIKGSLNLSKNFLESKAEKFNEKYFNNGIKGVSEWLCDNVIYNDKGELLYVCTDKNRKVFYYIDDEGNKIRDEKSENLKHRIKPFLNPKIDKIKDGKIDMDVENNNSTENIIRILKETKEIKECKGLEKVLIIEIDNRKRENEYFVKDLEIS